MEWGRELSRLLLALLLLWPSSSLYINGQSFGRPINKERFVPYYDKQPGLNYAAVSNELPPLPEASLVELASSAGQLATSRTKQLQTAYDDATEDIKTSLREILKEKKWIKDVETLVSSLNTKKANVEANLVQLGEKTRGLLDKRNKIKSLVLQSQLEEKLAEAEQDQESLKFALGDIRSKQEEFDQTTEMIQGSISKLKAAAAKLRKSPDSPPPKAAAFFERRRRLHRH